MEERIPRIMTIREIAQTGFLTESALRKLVKTGEIPVIKVGNRSLINFDKLLNAMS